MTTQEFIEKIITEPAEEAMSLFISYAHREALICRLIVCALKARGHHIWFDELNIPHGRDWRTEIMRGIESSSGVLSMISRDAVKPGGVCLDELSIAVGVRGGNIRTVLLEQDVTPPPTIMNRQWLDLTDWQNYKKYANEGEDILSDPGFAAWFGERIRILIGMLETRENLEFEGQITAIRKALPSLYISTSRQMFLLKEYHIERTWLREKVESWLDDESGESICIIYGDPGIGKSSFAANYSHYNGRVAAAIFCEKGQNGLNSPEAVIQTLVYMLACRIADYREYLANLLADKQTGGIENSERQSGIGSLNTDEMFEVLLATPLLHLIDGERPVECILVDGMDEAGSIENNELAAVLQKYAPRLPKWLRILILSRNISAVQKWFGEARQINLTAEIRENREDLERFVREQLREYDADCETKEKAIASIVSRSDGVFLYAKIILDALLDGKISTDEVNDFPSGLNQIYHRWFRWYVPDTQTYDNKVRPALNLMAVSPEPIPEAEILDVTGGRRKQLEEFKRLMQVHIRVGTNESGENTLTFSHLFVREWLVSAHACEYQIFEDDGILDLAGFFDEVLSEEKPEISEYEARYVLTVMGRAADLKRSMRRSYRDALRNEALMKRQEELGEKYWEWNRFYPAREYLQNALEIACCRTEDEDVAENRKHIVICKNRLSRIERLQGHADMANRYNEESLAIARQNLAERGLPEDKNRLAVALMMIADNHMEREDSPAYYVEAKDLLTQAVSEGYDVKFDRNLSIAYNRIGTIALQNCDYATAAESYMEDLRIAQRLAVQTGKPEARRDFAVSCYKLAGVYRICGKREISIYHYDLALKTMELLAKKRGQPEDIRGLIALLNAKCNYMRDEEAASDGALQFYERALAMSREAVSKYGLAKDYLYLAASLTNVGIELNAAGDRAGAKASWEEAAAIYIKHDAKEAETIQKWIRELEG